MTVDGLMKLDMAFCESVNKKGAESWANHFHEEGIMVTKVGDNIVSEEKIFRAMKPFFDVKGNALIWSPEGGGISDDETLGYTYGKYIRTTVDEEEGKRTDTGRYLTVWRQMAPGKYQVEIDMGN